METIIKENAVKTSKTTAKTFKTKVTVSVPKNVRNSIYLIFKIENESSQVISEIKTKLSSARWAEIQQTEAGAKMKGEEFTVKKQNGTYQGYTIYTLYP